MLKFKFLGVLTAIFVGGFFFSQPVLAADYRATPITLSGSGELIISPGEVKEVSVSFQNTSDVSWYNDGPGYVSLYTYEPKYRHSIFDPGTWLGPTQVKRIIEPNVASGGVASIKFELHAPRDEGVYTETFKLASEDRAWIEGGEITFTIRVENKELSVESELGESGYSGEISLMSANDVKAKAGASILFTVGIKNTGTQIWTNYSVHEPDVAIASTSEDDFSHPSWEGSQLAYAAQSVAPGGVAYISFAFKAPAAGGSHTASFIFAANDSDIVQIDIPVEVTGRSASVISAPEVETPDLEEEPILRVGILVVDEETNNEVVITSSESDFELRDTEGNLFGELEAGQIVTAYYQDGYYYFNGGRAYNLYRNVLELRYNDYKDRTWLINELSIEMYLRGLAETSNVSPEEYQKALVTAARTYAYYHYTRGTKRGQEFMHVVAYADDQVYRGYDHEIISPRIGEAVAATTGMVVTYEGDLAITPYFSRSDGRTRAWSEVWGGSVPWAQSVLVPWETGGTLWGHGVGMSALGALKMAGEGYLYEEILKYFYTGIELTKKW